MESVIYRLICPYWQISNHVTTATIIFLSFQTQKEAHSVDEVASKNPRRECKTQKPSHTTKMKPRRHRNRPLFSQKPAELLSETPADDSQARIPVPIVNVHADNDKAKDKAKQRPCKRDKKVTVVTENPQIEERKEVLGSSQRATRRRKIVPPRRSTLDFVDEKKKTKKKRKDNKKKRSEETATFVCTSCRKEDVDLMKQLASRFGSLKPATVVTPSTSHVVCGESRRTLSVLQVRKIEIYMYCITGYNFPLIEGFVKCAAHRKQT